MPVPGRPTANGLDTFPSLDRKLKKIAINGGAPVALCDVTLPYGASWGTDDRIVYGQIPDGIMRISANGGSPESIAKQRSKALAYPQILPDGKSVLYTAAVSTNTAQMRIVIQSLKSGRLRNYSQELVPVTFLLDTLLISWRIITIFLLFNLTLINSQ
jgi:hypothetical protein